MPFLGKLGRSRSRSLTGLSPNVFLIALTSFFADVSSEMAYPILPLFLSETLQVPATVVGLIEGIAEAIQYGVQGIAGRVSDRLPRKKPVAIAGYALAAIGKPIIGLATVWPVALTGRATDRLGAGSRTAPRDALIASSVGADARGRAFGLEGIGDNAGAFLGPLLALLLVGVLDAGYRLVFFLAFVPGLVAFGLILSVREPPAPPRRPSTTPVRFRPSPDYRRYLVVTATFGIGNSTNAFLILRLKEAGASFTQTMLVYACFNLVAALASYPAGAVADRRGRKPVLFGSLAVFAVVYVGFAAGSSVWLLLPLFAGYGVYQGAYRAVGKAFASDLVPADLRATGIGWYAATVGLTGLAASVIGGWLWSVVDPAATFAYGAACALTAAVALTILLREPHPATA